VNRSSGKPSTIRTVEVARGIAALLVVAFHANASADEFGGPQWSFLAFGEHGVDFFFVLSGFIIYTAHGHEIGKPRTAVPYALKRLIRLLPSLWIIVLGWALLRLGIGRPTDIAILTRSLLLYPSLEPTLPVVVWTLRHEIVFYAVFLVLLAVPKVGERVFLLWATAACVQLVMAAWGTPITGLTSFFLSSFNLDFMMGMLLGYVHCKRTFSDSFVPLVAALSSLLALMLVAEHFHIRRNGLSDYTSLAATWWTLLIGLAFAAVLHGLVRIDERVRVSRFGLQLGAASYSIYLLHTVVNSFSQRIAIHLPEWLKAIGAGHLLLIVAGTSIAMLFYAIIEKPMTRSLRRELLARSGAGKVIA